MLCPTQHTFRPRDTPHDRGGGGGANGIFFYLGGLELSFGGGSGVQAAIWGGWDYFFYLGGFHPPGGVGQITGGVGQITGGGSTPPATRALTLLQQ